MIPVRKTILHLFGAMGGGARGFKRARVQVAGMEGQWECLGSMDIDRNANRVFARRVGVPAIDIDFADRSQYVAINGHEPPEGWREATPADLRRATGGRRPDCIFLSAPCKGFSGLLPEAMSANPKYLAMNGLAQRALWLVLEAWGDDPVPLILFENVPRLMTRGRDFADQLLAMMSSYAYISRETVHDCGEIGGLGQSRKRCLIVARHPEKVPNFLYEPPRRPLRSVGDVIGGLWLPGAAEAGALHRVPRLQWKTWVRLAFVEAGSDWRSLNKLAVENGHLRDYLIVPEMHNGGLGVRRWEEPCGTVQSQSRPTNGAFSVADPRFAQSDAWNDGHAYGVKRWDQVSATVTAKLAPGSGYGSVADPRSGMDPKRGAYRTGGHYGVIRWADSSGAVSASACHDNGPWSVADPRTSGFPPTNEALEVDMPAHDEHLIAVIRSIDDTWHRPFTTLELAALQSLFDPDDPADVLAFTDALTADVQSDSTHREWIGNAVPSDAGEAIGIEILRTLLLADAGETFALSAAPIWVRPYVAALQLSQPEVA